jgi:hypothetical protein
MGWVYSLPNTQAPKGVRSLGTLVDGTCIVRVAKVGPHCLWPFGPNKFPSREDGWVLKLDRFERRTNRSGCVCFFALTLRSPEFPFESELFLLP